MRHPGDPGLAMSAENWRALSAELDHVLELHESEQQAWLATLQIRDPTAAAGVMHCWPFETAIRLLSSCSRALARRWRNSSAFRPAIARSRSIGCRGRRVGATPADFVS